MAFPGFIDDFNLEGRNDQSEQEMILLLADKVNEMMDRDMGLLLSYLYRLDVSESKVNAAMHQDDEPVAIAVARLIWERQKMRLRTKKEVKVNKDEDWEGLEW
jgi:hypothetical protein